MNTHKEPKQCTNVAHVHPWMGDCPNCQPPQEEQPKEPSVIVSSDKVMKIWDDLATGIEKAREEQPKNRSFFDMSDEEKKEIVDKAAEDSNKAQRKLMEEQPKDDFEESNLDYTKWTPTGGSVIKFAVEDMKWEDALIRNWEIITPSRHNLISFIKAQINLAVQKEKEQLTKKIIKFDKQKRRTVMKADSQPKKVLYIWCQAQEEFTQDIIAIINNKKEEES